eukprot:2771547-Pleurochrysis_carterae.AAC.1
MERRGDRERERERERIRLSSSERGESAIASAESCSRGPQQLRAQDARPAARAMSQGRRAPRPTCCTLQPPNHNLLT